MSRLAWLTPDELPTTGIRRWLCIPNTPALIAAVHGALLPLAYEENWELFGTQTPADTALAMSLMIEDFIAQGSACMKLQHEPIYLEDQKSQNVAGGSFNSGAWQQRVLNTKQGDTLELVTLSNNRFTLSPGRWAIEWSAPANLVQSHQTLLYSVTQSVGIAFGSSERTNDASNVQTRSRGAVVLDVASPLQCEIQHRCTVSRATNGFGFPANFGTEIYTQVKLTFIS